MSAGIHVAGRLLILGQRTQTAVMSLSSKSRVPSTSQSTAFGVRWTEVAFTRTRSLLPSRGAEGRSARVWRGSGIGVTLALVR